MTTLNDLTPQELQIALSLAEGRTTRETATALFLSPKTVEYHLRNVYRKFDIGSRSELKAAMARSRPDKPHRQLRALQAHSSSASRSAARAAPSVSTGR